MAARNRKIRGAYAMALDRMEQFLKLQGPPKGSLAVVCVAHASAVRDFCRGKLAKGGT